MTGGSPKKGLQGKDGKLGKDVQQLVMMIHKEEEDKMIVPIYYGYMWEGEG